MLTRIQYSKKAFKNSLKIVTLISIVLVGPSCSKDKNTNEAPTADLSSSLSMLVGSDGLVGGPKVYSFKVETSSGVIVERGGDLPNPGSTLTIFNLPSDKAAKVSASLYTLNIEPRFQTHACSSSELVKLEPGQTTSIALTCTPVVSSEGKPVQLFLKIAKGKVVLTENDPSSVLSTRNLNEPIVLSQIDSRKRRITIKQTTHGLAFHLGGEIGYYAPKGESEKSVLTRLVEGDSIEMTATAGSLLQAIPESATLKLTSAPMLYENEKGELKIALPFELNNTTGTAGFSGTLFEEGASSEFTVVAYNVENLFDQTDDDRNSGYGDYRISPNAQGMSSNYAEQVEFNGSMMNFTQIKIEGIRRALQAIDPAGPEVVGLVEIESRASLEQLLARMSDLGYVAGEFTDWAPNTTPNAVGLGLISKFPIKSKQLILPGTPGPVTNDAEPARPILKVTLDISGHDLIVYVNHWKSKGGPESMRVVSAKALAEDLKTVLENNPRADYIIAGDLNSNYNETITIEDEHNDTNNQTGINQVLNAQGDELKTAKLAVTGIKYNLHYELDRAARRTGWHFGHGWSSMDNMIVGAGLYDTIGVTYVDNSFEIPASHMERFKFLFTAEGTTNRWKQSREGNYTKHEAGGFADHLPIYARFRVAPVQDSFPIFLYLPSKPDKSDIL
jgi:hypothetical protein